MGRMGIACRICPVDRYFHGECFEGGFMSDAQTILKMIETVSPDDKAKLDEIDARVGFYLGEHKNLEDYYRGKDQDAKIEHAVFWGHITKYTRSRDALKAIRPEGWTFAIDASAPESGIEVMFWKGKFQAEIVSDCKTEELAELHAIIQAIEYERSQP